MSFDVSKAAEIVEGYGCKQSNLIAILQDIQTEQTPQKGGLAGAGRADHNNLLTGVDVLGDVVEHMKIAKILREIFNVDHFDAASFPKCPAAR